MIYSRPFLSLGPYHIPDSFWIKAVDISDMYNKELIHSKRAYVELCMHLGSLESTREEY